MKKIFILTLLALFFANIYSQINQSQQNKDKTKLDIAFQVLEESDRSLAESHIAILFDSLDQEAVKKIVQNKNPFMINEKGDTIYSIGVKAQGGIVFWVDKCGHHGLVVSDEDLASEITFYQGKTTSLTGDSVYAGKYNTEQIIANRSVGYLAAQICYNFQGGGFDDWYLPSKYELNLLYQQYRKRIIPNFARDFYWSSSEGPHDVAWLFRFYDGIVYNYPKYGSTAFRVRAIRAF